MRFTGGRKVRARRPISCRFANEKAKNAFRELDGHLVGHVQKINSEKEWDYSKSAMNAAAISASNLNTKVREDQWVSETFTALMMDRKLIPVGSKNDEE